MTEKDVREYQEFRFSDVVLTSADGQSIYATALLFFEDLAAIEEALNDFDYVFNETSSDKAASPEPHKEEQRANKAFGGTTKMMKPTSIGFSECMAENQVKLQRSVTREFDKDEYDDYEGYGDDYTNQSIREEQESKFLDQTNSDIPTPNFKLEKGKFFIERGICVLSKQPFFE